MNMIGKGLALVASLLTLNFVTPMQAQTTQDATEKEQLVVIHTSYGVTAHFSTGLSKDS